MASGQTTAISAEFRSVQLPPVGIAASRGNRPPSMARAMYGTWADQNSSSVVPDWTPAR